MARHFRSTAAYKRWLAYGHATGVFSKRGNQTVYIGGKRRRIRHDNDGVEQ